VETVGKVEGDKLYKTLGANDSRSSPARSIIYSMKGSQGDEKSRQTLAHLVPARSGSQAGSTGCKSVTSVRSKAFNAIEKS